MPVGGKVLDMTDAVVETYAKHRLDCLVCIGGGGTQKNALRLAKAGLNVITLPKTIDNDVAETDVTFGFDTAMEIGTEAIDRLHSTATSHNRIIVVELMGHRAGWLALGAGMAGGADVILIPEIPYDLEKVAAAITARSQAGKHFSIVAVAEGAMSREQHARVQNAAAQARRREEQGRPALVLRAARRVPPAPHRAHARSLAAARVAHGPGVAAHDPRPPAARRHAVGYRPRARDAGRDRGRGDGREQVLRDDGRGARRRDRAGSARRRGGQEEAGPDRTTPG